MASASIDISDHIIDSAGRSLFARMWRPAGGRKDAPTLVLFHDSLGCVELWRDFPNQLVSATGLPVIAYDRLGFGRSDSNPGHLDRNFMIEEAQTGFTALRQTLAFDRFISFGYSAGGGIAIAVAARFPAACIGVITQSAQAFVEEHTLAGIREAKIRFADPGQIARLARYHRDKAQWVVDAWIVTWLSDSFSGWNLDGLLPEVRCPVLAIHGDSDEYGSIAHPNRIASRSGGPATLVLLDDCGHVPHRECTEQVTAVVTEFIDGIMRPDACPP